MKQRYFNLAKKTAEKSSSRYKLGAVIVKKNRVTSFGYNAMDKTHTKAAELGHYGAYLHAEIHALIGCDIKDTKNATIYIYRETRNGELAESRPCDFCLLALKAAQIKKICYSTKKGFKEEIIH